MNDTPIATTAATTPSCNTTTPKQTEMNAIFNIMKINIEPVSYSFVSITLFLLITIVILTLYISHLKKLNMSRVPTVPKSIILSEMKTRPRECTPVDTQTKPVVQNNDEDDAMYDYPAFMPSNVKSNMDEVMEENELYALSNGTKKQSICVYDTIDENLLKQNLLKQKADLTKETNLSTKRTNSNEIDSRVKTQSSTNAKPEVKKSITEGVDDDWYATIDEAALKITMLQQNDIPQIRSSVADDEYACIDESALLKINSSDTLNNISNNCCQNTDKDEILTRGSESENARSTQTQKGNNHIYTSVDLNAKKSRKSVNVGEMEEYTKKKDYIIQTGVISILENDTVVNNLINENAEIARLQMEQDIIVKPLEEKKDLMHETIDESSLKPQLEQQELTMDNESDTSKDNELNTNVDGQNVKTQNCIVSTDDLVLQNDLSLAVVRIENQANSTQQINLIDLHSPTIESAESHEISDDVHQSDTCDTTGVTVTSL